MKVSQYHQLCQVFAVGNKAPLKVFNMYFFPIFSVFRIVLIFSNISNFFSVGIPVEKSRFLLGCTCLGTDWTHYGILRPV